jgi:hypothetical protein
LAIDEKIEGMFERGAFLDEMITDEAKIAALRVDCSFFVR